MEPEPKEGTLEWYKKLSEQQEARITQLTTDNTQLTTNNTQLTTDNAQYKKEREPTSVPAFLDAVHNNYQCRITVNPNPPALKLQEVLWDELAQITPTFFETNHFDSLSFIENTGTKVARRIISSEADLASITRQTIEDPVTEILEKMSDQQGISDTFNLGGRVYFENHGNSIDNEDEVIPRLEHLAIEPNTNPPRTPKSFIRSEPNQENQKQGYTYADQICIVGNTPAFIIEYKAPHKLTIPTLHDGLRDMDPLAEVVNRVEKRESVVDHAELLVAAVMTQTFDYMVNSRLQHGYICTGQTFVFLYIAGNDPTTLYYYPCIPVDDLQAGTAWKPDDGKKNSNSLHMTAVGRVLMFFLQAIRSPRLPAGWTGFAESLLKRWEEDYGEMLAKIPETVREEGRPSAYKARRKLIGRDDRSPYCLRSRGLLKSSSTSCAPESKCQKGDDDDEDDDPYHKYKDSFKDKYDQSLLDSPCPPPQAKKGQVSKPSGTNRHNRQYRSYCSQLCLLGLLRGTRLDDTCPNFDKHLAANSGVRRHTITQSSFLERIQSQLAVDLDTDVEDRLISGSRSAMFKVTLSSHGYTVSAKGTREVWVSDLIHEWNVYDHLASFQGTSIPVCLGNIHLEWAYPYSARSRLTHMMFMSYAGEPLHRLPPDIDLPTDSRIKIAEQAKEAFKGLHRGGVVQRDVAMRNLLWDKQSKSIFFIDFERSVCFGPSRPQPQIQNLRVTKLEVEAATVSVNPVEDEDEENHGCEFGKPITQGTHANIWIDEVDRHDESVTKSSPTATHKEACDSTRTLTSNVGVNVQPTSPTKINAKLASKRSPLQPVSPNIKRRPTKSLAPSKQDQLSKPIKAIQSPSADIIAIPEDPYTGLAHVEVVLQNYFDTIKYTDAIAHFKDEDTCLKNELARWVEAAGI
ncbi:uncharacterized protein KY384_008039 [Bacidia gigantensis]|uniref:uncharacterized protein n=1 Tax=Bacidia gigantensis TaxID=2732470 RepID=UPI001D051CFE|nr:uncharacterized protein KY384_008039 [Bacidia gigantensis]KAG8527295.1 hypothetical protein KY384_008039 [Bacidia gigantensis]